MYSMNCVKCIVITCNNIPNESYTLDDINYYYMKICKVCIHDICQHMKFIEN